jgi:predicted ArsR family transcriptional regulator
MMLLYANETASSGPGAMPTKTAPPERPIALDRESFLHGAMSELVDMLETVVGDADAAGFVAVVGQRLGETYEPMYRASARRKRLSREQVVGAILDFERRVHGEFELVSHDDERIVLTNRACPFGERVRGHPALCMITSSVLGVFVAQNLGYARVAIGKAIARGDAGCEVTIHLKPPAPGERAEGREYYEIPA